MINNKPMDHIKNLLNTESKDNIKLAWQLTKSLQNQELEHEFIEYFKEKLQIRDSAYNEKINKIASKVLNLKPKQAPSFINGYNQMRIFKSLLPPPSKKILHHSVSKGYSTTFIYINSCRESDGKDELKIIDLCYNSNHQSFDYLINSNDIKRFLEL